MFKEHKCFASGKIEHATIFFIAMLRVRGRVEIKSKISVFVFVREL